MNKFKHYLKEIIKSVVIITVVLNAYSYYRSQDLNTEKLPLTNISLNEKPIMIHFWATWCPVCKIEAPNIQRVSKDHNVLTIASQSGTDEEIKEYLKENDVDFNFINDKDNSYAEQFNITVYPTTLIYDKNRNLVFSDVGYTSTLGLYLRMWWAGL